METSFWFHYLHEQLTTPEPLFIHTIVSDGFPVQAQLNTASDPRSTCRDCGSAAIRGPTAENKQRDWYDTGSKHAISFPLAVANKGRLDYFQ